MIKHGALGDIILSTAPFAAIRQHHKNDKITLLTAKPYKKLLEKSPYFDEVLVDKKPKLLGLFSWVRLLRLLNAHKWEFVYDLQTSSRSSLYYKLIWQKDLKWSGVVEGSAFYHNRRRRVKFHTLPRQQDQLKITGINYEAKTDVTWLKSDIAKYDLQGKKYAILLAGGAAHRPAKRWPKESFAKLAGWLIKAGITPVLIGTEAEKEVVNYIHQLDTGKIINLCNKTDFADIAELGRNAEYAVGNDTGPMHIVAASGCKSLVLFSADSDPKFSAPLGDNITIIQRDDLFDLMPSEVVEKLEYIVNEKQKAL